MFEFSVLILKLLREGKIFSICNQEKNVYDTVCSIYSALFLRFIVRYVENSSNITKMDELNT